MFVRIMTALSVLLSPDVWAGDVFSAVQKYGKVRCGITYNILGFSQYQIGKNFKGFDADLCRAVAAIALGDPQRVEFVQISPYQQYEALSNRKVDIIASSTPRNFPKDVVKKVSFSTPIFFGTGGFFVSNKLPMRTVDDVKNLTICAQSLPREMEMITNFFKLREKKVKIIQFDTLRSASNGYTHQACEALFARQSHLYMFLFQLGRNGRDYNIFALPAIKLVYSLVSLKEDQQWVQLIRLALDALILAAKDEISSQTVKEYTETKSEVAQAFERIFDSKITALGIPYDRLVKMIQALGNYDEIYDRNLGFLVPYGLKRGANNLWTKGGFIYAQQ